MNFLFFQKRQENKRPLIFGFCLKIIMSEIKSETSEINGYNQDNLSRVKFDLMECDHMKCSIKNMIDDQSSDTITMNSDSIIEYVLKWKSKPKSCLIVKKPNNKQVSKDLLTITQYLTNKLNIKVFLEEKVVKTQNEFKKYPYFNDKKPGKNIDFMVVLGGDGTLLHITSLFQDNNINKDTTIPPCISFNRGSLGFLTPFHFRNYQNIINEFISINKKHFISIRMRLLVKVFRYINKDNKYYKLKDNIGLNNYFDDIGFGFCYSNDFKIMYSCIALNEILIHRGSSSIMQCELYINNKNVTSVTSDGLIIATPTGSTAYNVSAGGSLVAPNVHTIQLTPICPHTLSFRPVIINGNSYVTVVIPNHARYKPTICCDGKNNFQLNCGDIIVIQKSNIPLPTFKLKSYQNEWWDGLVTKLNWNSRSVQQKPF